MNIYNTPPKPITRKRFRKRYIAAALIAVMLFAVLTRPQRSVAQFCETLQTELTRLSQLKDGGVSASSLFEVKANNDPLRREFKSSLQNLDRVSPKEIQDTLKFLNGTVSEQGIFTSAATTFEAYAYMNHAKGFARTYCTNSSTADSSSRQAETPASYVQNRTR